MMITFVLLSTIVQVKHEADMGNTHFQQHIRTNCGGSLNNVLRRKTGAKKDFECSNLHSVALGGEYMQVYYIAVDRKESLPIGVRMKIDTQCEALKKHFSCKLTYVPLRGEMSLSRKIKKIIPFFSGYNLLDYNRFECNSIVYFRYTTLDHRILNLLKELHRKNIIVVMEIATYPYDLEYRTFWGKLVMLQEHYYRKVLKKYVSRIITYSNDDEIYEIETIKTSNGVNINDHFKIVRQDNTDCINVIAVASLAFWHGYDRFIQGLNEYYIHGGKRSIVFHVVGDGKILQEYKNLVKRNSLDKNVIFYGRREGEELNKLYLKCKIGIDSLGRHRSGVFYNSSLKGKEYLLKGLPIVSGVKTELDSWEGFNYYLRVPADDSPVDINRVVEFYDDIYENQDELEVRKDIRNFAIENFSYEATFNKVLTYLDEAVKR